MKGTPKRKGRFPKPEGTPQVALTLLAACRISGYLQGVTVVIEPETGICELLGQACLGAAIDIADSPHLEAGNVAEHVIRPTKVGDTVPLAGEEGAGPQHWDTTGSPEGLQATPLRQCKEGAPAGISCEHARRWGAACEVGKLGGLSISLPTRQAVRVESHAGIAFSRTAADNVRSQEPGHDSAEQPMHKSADVPKHKEKLWRKGRHAKRIRAEHERTNGTRGWALSLEEAFFMHHTLQALTVLDDERALQSQELWERCRGLKVDFTESYIPYHHYRSRGWVVQPGADYGADYVLYDSHPSEAHSSYCVLALTGSKRPECIRWTDIEAVSRVCSQVLKKLVLLYAFEEPGIAMGTPDCLAAITVEERLVERWVPGKT